MLQEAAEAAASCGSNPAQFGTLRASTPSGKAKTQQNCTPRLPNRLLEMQPLIPQSNRKNHMHFHRDFITSVLAWERHLRPAVSKQVYFAGFFFFLCNQNKFLRDESQGFKGVQGDVKQASSVNQ